MAKQTGSEDRASIVASIRTRTLANFAVSHTQQDEVIQIPSREAGRTIKAHIYHSLFRGATPLLINFHGSGFVIPFHGSDDDFARHISQTTSYTVLDVAYRLAPEDPFPAALHDVEDAVWWVLSKPHDFNVSDLAISGFSAGATLALVASSLLFPKQTFGRVILFYPLTDFAKSARTKVAPDRSGAPMPSELLDFFAECYIPSEMDPRDPRISPSYMELENFPEHVIVFTCAQDSLCGEAEDLVKRGRCIPGEKIIHMRLEGCGHAWDKSCTPGSVQANAKTVAYKMVTDFLSGQICEDTC